MKHNTIVRLLSRNRYIIQLILGLMIYVSITYFLISLWWVLIFGSFIGIIWGKIFCRWMCPVGIFMELIMKLSPDSSFRNMYQYHKIGCPIAWVSGLLNKFSLYKIQVNRETCTKCGLCDKSCYLSNIESHRFSLYKDKFLNPAQNFSCSKCLKCVEACPNGSLSYKPIGINKYKK
jgi:polyferredoxin